MKCPKCKKNNLGFWTYRGKKRLKRLCEECNREETKEMMREINIELSSKRKELGI